MREFLINVRITWESKKETNKHLWSSAQGQLSQNLVEALTSRELTSIAIGAPILEELVVLNTRGRARGGRAVTARAAGSFIGWVGRAVRVAADYLAVGVEDLERVGTI